MDTELLTSPEPPLPWPVEQVIDTELLKRRTSKPANYGPENLAMLELAQALATDPSSVVQRLVEAAMRLTGAGSAGLSLADSQDGEDVFRWIATAGEYTKYLHGTMPRNFSPCGEVLRQARPLLMRDLVQAYPYVEKLDPLPTEVLLVPFASGVALIGTVWVVAHAPDRIFDEEDLRVVKSLAVFASAVSATVGLVRDLEAREAQFSSDLQTSERQRRLLDELMTERDRAARAMARELSDTRRLRDVAARLIGAEGNRALFGEILDAAIEITEADAGTIQLYDPDTQALSFLSTRGFLPDIVAHFSRVDATSGSPCGLALASGDRAFVEFDPESADPDGSIRWHLDAGIRCAHSMPLSSRTGRPLGIFSTHWRNSRSLSERELRFLDLLGRQAADLIERTQVEEALRSSEQELREGARRKDEFLAVLAHELRNPLAPIRSGVELLKRANDPLVAKVRPMMERQVSHMVRLVDDLLDVSRITSNKVELKHETVSLRSLIDTAVEANRDAIAAAGLTLDVRVDDPDRSLTVDPTRLSQVLSNILHNATKFTGAGGTLTISTEVSYGHAQANAEQVFRIADTGMGIPQDRLPTIFDLFTQVRPDSSLRHGGMGIGLALSRSLVELHGGTIQAESAGAGLGSTFVVRIPMLGVATVQPSVSPTSEDVGKLARLQVLVVDDNRDAADTLGFLLSTYGGDVRVAYHAEAALNLLGDFDPSLILLDIGMPGMDGYEACRRIREIKGDTVRIVALTGWGQEEDRQRSTAAGFDEHLTKPVDINRLEAIATQCAGEASDGSPSSIGGAP
jgi:signal transduction histidine kinase/ActR/RegA family two-component response regulator